MKRSFLLLLRFCAFQTMEMPDSLPANRILVLLAFDARDAMDKCLRREGKKPVARKQPLADLVKWCKEVYDGKHEHTSASTRLAATAFLLHAVHFKVLHRPGWT